MPAPPIGPGAYQDGIVEQKRITPGAGAFNDGLVEHKPPPRVVPGAGAFNDGIIDNPKVPLTGPRPSPRGPGDFAGGGSGVFLPINVLNRFEAGRAVAQARPAPVTGNSDRQAQIFWKPNR